MTYDKPLAHIRGTHLSTRCPKCETVMMISLKLNYYVQVFSAFKQTNPLPSSFSEGSSIRGFEVGG